MGATLGLLLLFADVSVGRGASSPELVAAAAASPRPAECRRTDAAAEKTSDAVWERARLPRLRRYCDALAFGYARLSRSPDAALAQAGIAELVLPGRAETLVLRARASLELHEPEQAWIAFERARVLSRRSVEGPGALLDRGRSALETGRYREAVSVYRALVPRVRLLDSPSTMQRVYLEAAALAMWTGASGLNEATGYLGEARRAPSALGLSELASALLALALDRQGLREEALGILNESGDDASFQRITRSARAPVLPPGEFLALAALLLERRDRAGALTAWRDFSSKHPSSPWLEHARAHIARLTNPRAKAER